MKVFLSKVKESFISIFPISLTFFQNLSIGILLFSELEYEVTNRNTGKLDFVQIIRDYEISYKKSQAKLKRAYDALRRAI